MMIIYQDYLIVFEKQSHWCSSWDCQIILGLNVPEGSLHACLANSLF